MSRQSLFVIAVVTCSTLIGATIATQTYSKLQRSAPQSPTSALPIAAPIAQLSPISEPVVVSPTAPPRLRQPLEVQDLVQMGSDFYQFRQAFRQAVRDRNFSFIEKLILPNGLSIGYGRPRTATDLDLKNPNAQFWLSLEKAIAQGCSPDADETANVDANSPVWVCPNLMQAFTQQYPNPGTSQGIEYEMSRVIVAGEAVNVRSQPNDRSPVVATLSNEVVSFDRATWDQMPEADRLRQSQDVLNGWTPVLLSDRQPGYIANRYAYFPLGERLVFGQVNQQWKILYMPAGD